MPADALTAWSKIEDHFDILLDLSPDERISALETIGAENPELRRELEELLAYSADTVSRLDRPALGLPPGMETPGDGLPAGYRIGNYSIVGLLGRGGMGEVYRAERADGQFEQQVALKLIRPEAVENLSRFQHERQMLARLEHPNISRIYDGGVLPDGRPYMVMELIDGQTITDWCCKHAANLNQRLELFLAACRAVAYAHRNLIVHRDLKPGNILVTSDGAVKILDFGIAKQIEPGGYLETRPAPFTPTFAAPEQLTGGVISTATDSYALGILLFELLAGTPPWRFEDVPLAAVVDLVVNQPLPTVSRFAARMPEPPVPPRSLSGDIDAIVAKAVRKEPAQRYQSVDALIDDVDRYRHGRPVGAREGSRAYVVGRFIRRHRWPIAGAMLTTLAILGGLAGVSTEYVRAEHQATRAETIKTFLEQMFNDSDPAFPTDKPRDQVTANELLALAVNRIDHDFAKDPQLKIELLNTTADIYFRLSEVDKFKEVRRKLLAEERKTFGPHNEAYLRHMLNLANILRSEGTLAEPQTILDETDKLITEAGLDRSGLRADWWRMKGQLLRDRAGAAEERLRAYEKALDLYARYAPHNKNYATALSDAAVARYDRHDYAGAVEFNSRALAILSDPRTGADDSSQQAAIYGNLADALSMTGDLAAADHAYQDAATTALHGNGTNEREYWYAVSGRARALHLEGDRIQAMSLFEELLPKLPVQLESVYYDIQTRRIYACRLVAEGRAEQAIPILEAIIAKLRDRGQLGDVGRQAMWDLGDAYDRVGRTAEARALLGEVAATMTAPVDRAFWEWEMDDRWGRFLLDHGDPEGAARIFDEVIATQDGWAEYSVAAALAWSGRARLALAAGHTDAALDASNKSLDAYAKVRSVHEVRAYADLLLVHSAVLLAAGDNAGAAKDAEAALAESQRTDAPESPAIEKARTALAVAKRAGAK